MSKEYAWGHLSRKICMGGSVIKYPGGRQKKMVGGVGKKIWERVGKFFQYLSQYLSVIALSDKLDMTCM